MSEDYEIYLDGRSFGDLSMAWHYACSLCFSNDDLFSRKIKDAHPVVRETFIEWVDDENQEIVYLLAPAEKVRRRLHIQGYTDERSMALWEREYPLHIARLEEFHSEHGIELKQDIKAQKGLTFEEWLVRSEQLSLEHLVGRGSVTEFDLHDPFASLALELRFSKSKAVWTEIGTYADAFDPELTFHENFASVQSFDDTDQDYIHATNDVLILTEGKSDTKILSAAIKAMYPEYADLFQFVDFEGFSISGGASMLTQMIKAFAGVRMRQHILALFDNDAAGIAELRKVSKIKTLPPNIKTMLLPDITLAENYPTIGPEGARRMNVNGAASSIELFLGKAALTDDDGSLHEIRWTNWSSQIDCYQGALENKDSISRRFLESIQRPATPDELKAEYPEMDLLLNAIFRAFH